MSYLWTKPEVPHKGWINVDVIDLESATHTCEMCDRDHIRYVHEMQHPEYTNLYVGCVCAEKMSDDYVTPSLQKQAKIDLANWRSSFKQETITSDVRHHYKTVRNNGAHIIGIFNVDDQFRVHFNYRMTHLTFKTLTEAKNRLYEIVRAADFNRYDYYS